MSRTFEYDGGREVTVYIPPGSIEAVVFGGDGQLISRWGGDLEVADAPATMIVGVHRTGAEDEMVRLREYSLGFDAQQFAAHERCFTHEVRDWVKSRFGVALPASRTAVIGVSASAEFSLAMGLRYPELYGVVFSASPGGGFRPPAVMPGDLPRTYLTAGTREPFFLENAERWAAALRSAGAEVVMTKPIGDHGEPFWQTEFVKMVTWAFGR